MSRGEVWWVQFDPGRLGDEMRKTRPAVVVNDDVFGVLRLRLVVPLTGRKASHEGKPWLIDIAPNAMNGLEKRVSADVLQITCISEERLCSRMGSLSAEQMVEIAAAIAMVVGYA